LLINPNDSFLRGNTFSQQIISTLFSRHHPREKRRSGRAKPPKRFPLPELAFSEAMAMSQPATISQPPRGRLR